MQTLTKVYERHDVARQVVVELETAGFPTTSISLLANKAISDQYGDVDAAAEPGSGAGVSERLSEVRLGCWRAWGSSQTDQH
jgi:hypothetical protein